MDHIIIHLKKWLDSGWLVKRSPVFMQHQCKLQGISKVVEVHSKSSEDNRRWLAVFRALPNINEYRPNISGHLTTKLAEDFQKLLKILRILSEIFEDIWNAKHTAACLRILFRQIYNTELAGVYLFQTERFDIFKFSLAEKLRGHKQRKFNGHCLFIVSFFLVL